MIVDGTGSVPKKLALSARWPWLHGLRGGQFEHFWLIILAAITGVLGAFGNLGFRILIEACSWVFRGLEWNALGIPRGSFFVLLVPVVLLSGGAVLLILDYFFPGDALGYGFPDFLVMLHSGRARIKRRWIFVKAAGAALSLGAGASVGREGPIAQIGGAIGSAVAQLARLSAERARVLVACGAGAGIAATFNAPIGGLMFAQEIILLGEMELANLTLLIVATTSGVITSRRILGDAAIFNVHRFVLSSYWELLSYGLMGLMLGLLSALYIRLFHGVTAFFKRHRLPTWAMLGSGLFVVGLIGAVLPQNLSDGYPVIDEALAGRLPVPRMAVLGLAKIFASSISLGCGAPGGVFGPIFFIGTMAGGSFRGLSALLLPGLTGPRGSYALVGLGAFLAATSSAPLTAVFLLFEMTQDYTIALPALVSTIIALAVARALESESIDTYALAQEGKTLQVNRERIVLAQIPVAPVMASEPAVLRERDLLSEVLRLGGETSQSILPVLGDADLLTGVIVTRDLLALIAGREQVSDLINAHDICTRDFPTVTSDSSLDDALQRIENEGVEELPVVDAEGRLLGIVSRHAIAQALNRTAISLSSLASREPSIQWSTGYRLTRMTVSQAGQGKTLRSIDPRARFGVSVLAVRDASGGFVTIEPDRPLQTGDVIVAAGRPAGLRMFQREI